LAVLHEFLTKVLFRVHTYASRFLFVGISPAVRRTSGIDAIWRLGGSAGLRRTRRYVMGKLCRWQENQSRTFGFSEIGCGARLLASSLTAWYLVNIFGGRRGAELEPRRPDIALPVLAGERRAATLPPSGEP
jgi:hypothetical protein